MGLYLLYIPVAVLIAADIERVLLDLGALKESDARLKKRSDSVDEERQAGNYKEEDYDDDWD